MNRYLQSTYRYFKNNFAFLFINQLGLILGLSIFFFAYQYVRFEWSYDRFNENYDKIYRLVTDLQSAHGIEYESASAPTGAAIKEAFPEVEAYTRVFLDYVLFTNEEKDEITQENLAYVDPNVFSVFTLPLLKGNPETALDKPFSLVLSETAARKFFGTTDCIGKTLILDSTYPATVTAIMKDMPYNSHFRTDIMLSMSSLLEVWAPFIATQWKRFGFYTYLVLKPGTSLPDFNRKVKNFLNDHIDDDQITYTLKAEPLKGLYFDAKARGTRYGSAVVGNISNLYIFSIVAILVLVIAHFNFINLSIALSLKRAREVGIRKVLGASRSQLVWQFILDALVISVISFIAVVVLAVIFRPYFNQLAGKPISRNILGDPHLMLVLGVICLVSGLTSVLYSALYLMRIRPVHTLKGKYMETGRGRKLKNLLVVLQFAISIVLIVSTLVMHAQLQFMHNYDLGFKQDQQLIVDFHFDKQLVEHEEMLKQQFTAIAGVQSATFSNNIPGRLYGELPVLVQNADNELQEMEVIQYSIDPDFVDQYELQLVAGRNFHDQEYDIRKTVILNQTAVKELGYDSPEKVIGKQVTIRDQEAEVIGVVNDFHYSSLREKVRPMCIRFVPSWFTFITFRISPENQASTIRNLEHKWKELVPKKPFIYLFYDQEYNAQYQSEQRFGRLFIILTTVAIIISCLGLLGVAAFSMEQRTREVGIRKVLGASIPNIMGTLLRDFLLLVLIAFVIAVPVAWYGMDRWLQDFAYRQGIGWSDFVVSGLVAGFIAVLTVSFHTIKSSLVNPVEILRDE